jgi:hypothetical protein
MNDMNDPIGSVPTPEEQARITAVEQTRLANEEKLAQKREADKLRKQAQRARERFTKDRDKTQREARLRAEEESAKALECRMERVRMIVSELSQEPDDEQEYRDWVVGEIEMYLMQFDALDFSERMFYEILYDQMNKAHGRSESLLDLPMPSLPEPNQWLEPTRLAGRMEPIYSEYRKLKTRLDLKVSNARL